MNIVSNEEMINIENNVINSGLSQEILMENAGLGIFHLIKEDVKYKNVLILCGAGNNGGDSLVIARKLFSNEINLEILFTSGVDSFRGSAKKNLDIINKLGIPQKSIVDIENFSKYLDNFDVIIDGIFGTGLNKNIEQPIFDIIKTINEKNKFIISIDIPSGINGNSGKIMGIALKSNKTIALGNLKIGNILYPGTYYSGDLYLNNLSISKKYNENIKTFINSPIKYKDRDENSHKGSFRKVLFVGGSKKYYGAPYLNAVSFLKSGGSYSNLACPEGIVAPIALKANEIVFHPLKETREGSISIENLKEILDISNDKELCIIGGGLSREEEPQRLVNILTSKIFKPIIIDADGLVALKDKMDSLLMREYPTILTPHLGEMSILINKSVEEIKEDIINISRNFATRYRVILVLKDSRTIIALPNGEVFVNLSGNSALSVAGSGDILTGVIAAQFALGLSIEESARMGVFIHGLCGDLLKDSIGQDGVMAQDILNYLPKTLKYFRENYSTIKNKYDIEEV